MTRNLANIKGQMYIRLLNYQATMEHKFIWEYDTSTGQRYIDGSTYMNADIIKKDPGS